MYNGLYIKKISKLKKKLLKFYLNLFYGSYKCELLNTYFKIINEELKDQTIKTRDVYLKHREYIIKLVYPFYSIIAATL